MAEEKKDKEKTVKEAPAAAPAAEPKAAAPEAPAAAPAAPADPLATGTEEAKPAPRRRVKGSKNIPVGVVHILASFNNTVVSITDPAGNVISWSSGGRCGFKRSRKSKGYAGNGITQGAGSYKHLTPPAKREEGDMWGAARRKKKETREKASGTDGESTNE